MAVADVAEVVEWPVTEVVEVAGVAEVAAVAIAGRVALGTLLTDVPTGSPIRGSGWRTRWIRRWAACSGTRSSQGASWRGLAAPPERLARE